MYHCAECQVKNCTKEIGKEGEFPKNCPSVLPEMEEILKKYGADELDYRLARESSILGPNHDEGRVEKTIRFAKACGFHKIGLGFCITLRKEAAQLTKLLREEGFEVESLICKVGHVDRSLLEIDSCKAMCNPIAQAVLLNEAHTT